MLGDDDAYKVTVMDSIRRIEMLSAPIKHKFVKGITSAKLYNTLMMEQTRSDIGPSQQSSNLFKPFDCLVMLDRSVDLVSPFCTPRIYEGLLDEAFGL